jgi:hypothetical protein
MYKNNLSEPEVIRNLNSEIKRYDVINYLIDKYNLVNYLEIGVFQGENIRKVKAQHKDGVDPGAEGYVVPEVNYPITSNAFFELIKGHDEIIYDIIFIDGLHEYKQVSKDIQNSLRHLKKGGFIVLHDCNPVSYEAQLPDRQTIAWNGDTWKAFVEYHLHMPGYKFCCIDTDFGVGIIQTSNNNTYTFQSEFLNYEYFDSNRKQLLNLITWDEFKATY